MHRTTREYCYLLNRYGWEYENRNYDTNPDRNVLQGFLSLSSQLGLGLGLALWLRFMTCTL